MKIELGDRVKDGVTGFAGIVIARSEYMNGCRRFGVQPERVSKDGSIPKDEWFDEPALVLIEKGVHSAIPIPDTILGETVSERAYLGGPARSGDRRR